MADMDVVMEEASANRADERELIQPVALLMDELKSEDTAIRVESMRRLSTISLALGPERTRNELLPFLHCSLDEEDEVLFALADNVVTLVEHVGGQTFAHNLVPLLEGLVSAEEPYVRNRALEAYATIMETMPTVNLVEHVLLSIQRLATGDWFSKKSSAASLITFAVRRLMRATDSSSSSSSGVDGKQSVLADLLKLFESLLFEETPLVRKAVANNLASLATLLTETVYLGSLVPFCAQLASDPQDSVRLLSVEPLAVLLKECHEDAERMAKLFPLFLALASDSSWRIRFMVASNYGKLALALQSATSIDSLGIYCTLLRDVEGEVRAAASSQVSKVATCFSLELVEEQIVAAIKVLLTDPSSHVRASLALQLNDLARVLGADRAASLVLPTILQLLRDDSSEVRLNVISKLNVTVDVIGIQQLSASLLPAIVALAEDRQWRVRQTIIEYIPDLSCHLGKDFFAEKILPLLVDWLEDPVYSVRETTVASLMRVMGLFGSDWADATIIPLLLPLSKHRNYLRRMTFLSALSTTCSAVPAASLRTQYLPILERLASDPIPNVRFNVAKTLQAMVPVMVAASSADADTPNQDIISNSIIPILQQLQRDADTDVHDFATQALNIIPAF